MFQYTHCGLGVVNALNIFALKFRFFFSQISGFSPQPRQSKRNAQGVCGQVDYLSFGPFISTQNRFLPKKNWFVPT